MTKINNDNNIVQLGTKRMDMFNLRGYYIDNNITFNICSQIENSVKEHILFINNKTYSNEIILSIKQSLLAYIEDNLYLPYQYLSHKEVNVMLESINDYISNWDPRFFSWAIKNKNILEKKLAVAFAIKMNYFPYSENIIVSDDFIISRKNVFIWNSLLLDIDIYIRQSLGDLYISFLNIIFNNQIPEKEKNKVYRYSISHKDIQVTIPLNAIINFINEKINDLELRINTYLTGSGWYTDAYSGPYEKTLKRIKTKHKKEELFEIIDYYAEEHWIYPNMLNILHSKDFSDIYYLSFCESSLESQIYAEGAWYCNHFIYQYITGDFKTDIYSDEFDEWYTENYILCGKYYNIFLILKGSLDKLISKYTYEHILDILVS